MVLVVLLTVMMVAAARLIVPPESTMAPEPEAKVMSPESTVPLTVMGPAARPVAPLPKLMESVVAVVKGAKAFSPVALRDQPATVPAVGAAQVPVDAPAVPKPAVASSSSQ